jgi:transcriptional regulator with XRE-family HTH domain
MQLVGVKIRKIRELQDLTQDNMATQLVIKQAAYSKIERGETDISYSTLKKIAELLGIDVVSLLTFDSGLVIHKIAENQQGSETNGFVFNNGLTNKERELYERKITLLQDEVNFLRTALDKVLGKTQ